MILSCNESAKEAIVLAVLLPGPLPWQTWLGALAVLCQKPALLAADTGQTLLFWSVLDGEWCLLKLCSTQVVARCAVVYYAGRVGDWPCSVETLASSPGSWLMLVATALRPSP